MKMRMLMGRVTNFINHKHRKLALSVLVLLSMVLFILAGIFSIGYQVMSSSRQHAETSAKKAVERVDSLLKEAENAADQTHPFLLSPVCSEDIKNGLDRMAIVRPHLRMISLLHKNRLTCSSFGGVIPHEVSTKEYAGGRLSLHLGSTISPDTPVLILLTYFPEGIIASSLDVSHIEGTLSLLNTDTPLFLSVGDKTLGFNGLERRVLKNPRVDIRSLSYPYGIEYSKPSFPAFTDLIKQSPFELMALIIFAILSCGAVGIYISKEPDPYKLLAKAIDDGEVIPWYQPIVRADSGTIYGVEVLARWFTVSGTVIPPDIFIPLAERTGLIIPLTQKLLIQVAKDLDKINEKAEGVFHISINLSAAHLLEKNKTEKDLRDFKSNFSEDSIQVVAEITEREPFEKTGYLDDFLLGLQKLGIKIALDDFGTGYSNLSYLNTLPVDYIKIDKSFTSQITEYVNTNLLVEHVIDIARTFNMTVIAEGVETEFQRTWLEKKSVPLLQGYYFSRPLPAVEFIKLIS